MRISAILAISLAAVLAGSLLLASPFSIKSVIPKQIDERKAEAAEFPLMVRDRFKEIQKAGDAMSGSRYLEVNEDFIDPENHCEFCTRIEYVPGPQGQAGFSYKDVAGLDLSNAKKVRLWAMGEDGNEKIKFKLAGKSLDKTKDNLVKLSKLTKGIFKTERFALTTEEVTLENNWKKYEVDLTGVELEGITHPFGLELSGNDAQVVYIKGVIYDDEIAEDPLLAAPDELIEPLAAEIISNATEGTAPSTFSFEANITGGTEPYTIMWNFDGNGSDESQNVVHTFTQSGEYNVTLAVSDATDQNASDSVRITVVEPEIEEEIQVLNDTDQKDNSDSTIDTTNSTDVIIEEQATIEPIEIQVDAGIDVVSQPGDDAVLAGVVTGVDLEFEGLELLWKQMSGPAVEISGADTLNPRITIPDLQDDTEIELEFTVSAESTKDSDSVTVFVESVKAIEGSEQELLYPAEEIVTEWESECNDLADCMSDDSGETVTVASPEDAEHLNLFSFEEFGVENAEIAYVIAVATARSDEPGYIMFIGADADDEQDKSEPLGAVSIVSSSFREYEYVWEENPITNSPWTAGSLNSFLAGYAYGDGASSIEVSEFTLIVTFTVQEEEEASTENEISAGTEEQSEGENAEEPVNKETQEEPASPASTEVNTGG